MKKTIAIVNPASSNGKTGSTWPSVKAVVEQAGLILDDQMTSRPGEATILTRNALKQGYQTIISVGGDGTLNEVMNGFFENDRLINPDSALGIISRGTGSDFVKAAGIPRDVKLAAKILAEGRSKKIDVGRITFQNHQGKPETRYFINVAGMGMDGDIVDKVNTTSKVLGGFISFLWATLRGLMGYRNRTVTLEIDGMVRYHGPIMCIAVGNGQYFGSGMRIAPAAQLDSGRFEIVIVEGVTKTYVLRNLPGLYKGTHINKPEVTCMQGHHVKATSTQKVLLDVDGEQPGVLDCEMDILPAAFNLIC
ncbi:MAG: diacylglycerol/lipid kinase family protein [Chitinophagales bacterium]